mmetsp:Transcript_39525/g.77784  ORF Transcript_39525/g.77784 Transcript_39525/m.77784 type:complete len:133 (+) Transcript_39525:141-539(+)
MVPVCPCMHGTCASTPSASAYTHDREEFKRSSSLKARKENRNPPPPPAAETKGQPHVGRSFESIDRTNQWTDKSHSKLREPYEDATSPLDHGTHVLSLSCAVELSLFLWLTQTQHSSFLSPSIVFGLSISLL